jgi:hypothetical protein
VREVDALLAKLEDAADDDARSALVAIAPTDVLDQLRATIAYRSMGVDIERKVREEVEAHDAFTRSLQDAPDDAARLSVIRAADPEFVSAWQWRQRATHAHWPKLYLATIP